MSTVTVYDKATVDSLLATKAASVVTAPSAVIANTGSAYAINYANGTAFVLTLNSATPTLTLTGAPAAPAYVELKVWLKQDATGTRVPTWPASVKWPGNVTPTLSTTANAVDQVNLVTFDGGTTWQARLVDRGFGTTVVTGGGGGGGGTTFTESADPTTVTTTTGVASAGSITNHAGHVFAINAGGQVTIDGVADTTSNNVVKLYYHLGVVYQQNGAGQWYTEPAGGGPGTFQTTDPTGGGTTGGGTSGSGPAGVTGTFTKLFEDTFTSTTLNAEWIPNRWAGTLPTNEDTNIPGSQLDSSYSGNIVVGGGLMKLNISNQVDSSRLPGHPYCGAHLTGTTGWLQQGRVVEVVARIAKNGSCWPSVTYYGVSSGIGGEIDAPEFDNVASNADGWFNIHKHDYSAQTLGATTGSLGMGNLAGDGSFHTYTVDWSAGGTTLHFWVDGVLKQTGAVYDVTSFIISLELGVSNGSPAAATTGTVIECQRVTVWG